MTYPSIEFLYFVLFVGLFIAFLSKQFKIWFLVVASLIWIASWRMSWAFTYAMIASINYGFLALASGLSSRFSDKLRHAYFVILLSVNLILFVILKTGKIGSILFSSPYGVSFFMFMIMGFIIDRWRNPLEQQVPKCSEFLLFPTFFGTLMGGPISRGKNFFKKLDTLEPWSYERSLDGLILFGFGFLKFYFLSKALADLNSDLAMWSRNSLYSLVLMGLVGTMQAYIDFSSYCDMGRGVARAYGIDLEVNFKPIIFSKNPNDFWQRWNITLGTWIRDYISFPLMLRFGRKLNQQVLLFLTFIIVGLWHGLSWNWLLFGVFNGVIVILFNQINKWRSLPFLGRVLVAFIFVGNGLLQQKDFFLQIPAILTERFNSRIGYVYWGDLANHFSLSVVVSLLVILAIDIYQEKRGSADWFTGMNIFVKTLLVIIFLAWVAWGLTQNHFIEEVILPPVYFKI